MHDASSAHDTQSSTVDLMTLLLVLAGDHQASANANAKTLLRLAEPERRRTYPHISLSRARTSTPTSWPTPAVPSTVLPPLT